MSKMRIISNNKYARVRRDGDTLTIARYRLGYQAVVDAWRGTTVEDGRNSAIGLLSIPAN